MFTDFIANLAVQNSEEISGRYGEITRALNKKYRDSESRESNTLQVGSYGRYTAINGISDLDMIYMLPDSEWSRFKDGRQSALLQEVKSLYYKVKASEYNLDGNEQEELKKIQSRYHKRVISKQILFSDWYAHYKFFWQHQIEWIEEQKKFSFWRDKVPLTLILILFASIVIAVGYYYGEDILNLMYSLKETKK